MKPLETRRRPFGVEKAHQWHQLPLNCTFLHCIRKKGTTQGSDRFFFNEINGLAQESKVRTNQIPFKISHLQRALKVSPQGIKE
jgi:hypothetical protein